MWKTSSESKLGGVIRRLQSVQKTPRVPDVETVTFFTPVGLSSKIGIFLYTQLNTVLLQIIITYPGRTKSFLVVFLTVCFYANQKMFPGEMHVSSVLWEYQGPALVLLQKNEVSALFLSWEYEVPALVYASDIQFHFYEYCDLYNYFFAFH